MADKLLCTVFEIESDLDLFGLAPREESKLIDRIVAASDWIENNRALGAFIPHTLTESFDGKGGREFRLAKPLLEITSITSDGSTLSASDYIKRPRNGLWDFGPCLRLEIDPDASSLSAWSSRRDGISIVGKWGKYLSTLALSATVANTTEISSSGTSLKVSNGAKVSPGMVLLCGTEQLVVNATEAKTSVASLSNGAQTDTALTLTVDSGADFNINEVIRLDSEDQFIEDIASNVLTVKRGWNGTTQAAHANDTAITVQRTYTVKRGCNGTTAAAHANGATLARYMPPMDVNGLARQIAGLMQKKAQAAWAGKSGSAELGTIFYNDEFPKRSIEQVAANYRITRL